MVMVAAVAAGVRSRCERQRASRLRKSRARKIALTKQRGHDSPALVL
jgi:hypothetical protein